MSKIKIVLEIDTVSGEVLANGIPIAAAKPSEIKTILPEVDYPQMVLEASRVALNSAAIKALGIKLGDKVGIGYEDTGAGCVPVIGTSDIFPTGNKLTKAGTISCRGVLNEELSKFGSVFKLIAHPTKENVFKLEVDKTDAIVEDDNLDLPIEPTNDELDLDFLTEDNKLMNVIPEEEKIFAVDFTF